MIEFQELDTHHPDTTIAPTQVFNSDWFLKRGYSSLQTFIPREVPPKSGEKFDAFKRISDPKNVDIFSAEAILDAFGSGIDSDNKITGSSVAQ